MQIYKLTHIFFLKIKSKFKKIIIDKKKVEYKKKFNHFHQKWLLTNLNRSKKLA
jgi:hypothetical protein